MEESQKEEMRFCNNCQREVSLANYQLHVHHCEKNITCCKQCNEPVPRSGMQEHIDSTHKLVRCTKCYRELECGLLEDHVDNECPMRMVDCQYCELQVKAGEHVNHEDQCGSRTDICVKCQQYVMLKEMKLHDEHLCGKQTPTTMASQQLPQNEWPIHRADEGGTSDYRSGAVPPVQFDQSWLDAINACKIDGLSVDSLVAQNLAQENGKPRHVPVDNVVNGSDEDYARQLQENEERTYYDFTSPTAAMAEEQQKQFEQLRQFQSDAELALKLQEELNAEDFDVPVYATPKNDHMMPEGDHMLSNMNHVMPSEDSNDKHEWPSEDHVTPDNDHMMHGNTRNAVAHDTADMFPPENSVKAMTDLSPDNFQTSKPERRLSPENLLPCELCGKGIPPEYLQTHQLQQCVKLQSHDMPPLPLNIKVTPTPVTDHHDITPTASGSYSVVECEYCKARIPNEQYRKHLELCDSAAAATAPCEHCHQSVLMDKLLKHEALCRHNNRLYRPAAMKFPNSEWPVSKGKNSRVQKRSLSKVAMPKTHEPVTMSTENSLSSSGGSYHDDSDEPDPHHQHFHPKLEPIDLTASRELTTRVKPATVKQFSHGPLARRPLHTYTPAGAGSVSVSGTGIKATPRYPPSAQY